MSSKVKVNLFGQEFLLNSDVVRTDGSWYKEPYIYLNAKNTAVVIRQFIKKNFPNLKSWVKSEVYSGGSSVNVYVCSKDGSPAPYDHYDTIQTFCNSLTAGTFNGMFDSYEYREDKLSTEKGTPIVGLPSYIFTNNRPDYGTVEYWVQEFKEFDESNYSHPTKKFVGDTPWERFLNWNRPFFSKGIEPKLIEFVAKLNTKIAA